MNEILLPERYNVYMQDLDNGYLELVELGHVRNIDEAKTMVKMFREALSKQHKNATVFFQLADVD